MAEVKHHLGGTIIGYWNCNEPTCWCWEGKDSTPAKEHQKNFGDHPQVLHHQGRPAVLRKCPSCEKEMGTRALRSHLRECRLTQAVRRVFREMQNGDASEPSEGQYFDLGKVKR